MLWESKLDNWVKGIRSKHALPLQIKLWNGKTLDFSSNPGRTPPDVVLTIPEISSLPYLMNPSLASLGEGYVEGKLNIEGKLDNIIRTGTALAQASSNEPEGRLTRLVRSFTHTKNNDSDAVRYHYDVSNEFYQSWLDERMVYSCAYFENGDETLDQAQLKKIDHILNKIQLQPGQSLLDIGCGWGALVMRAASKFNARCVGITLSENQYQLARERVRAAGLEDRIDIRLQDYRDLDGQFDRITSVGMFEHVGLNQMTEYFSIISRHLKDDGIVMNHGITTTDIANGEAPYGGGEFIDKYVFPQGELQHIGFVLQKMQEGGLESIDIENLRRHYAYTCSLWAARLEASADSLRKMAGEKRYRIWRLYLAGSAYGFEHDWISLYQVVCRKAGNRAQMLPWNRRYIYQGDIGQV